MGTTFGIPDFAAVARGHTLMASKAVFISGVSAVMVLEFRWYHKKVRVVCLVVHRCREDNPDNRTTIIGKGHGPGEFKRKVFDDSKSGGCASGSDN